MNFFKAFKPPETSKPFNISKWFVSEKGRKVANILASVTAAGCFTSYLIPHAFFLSKTKSVLQMYKDGDPVDLPKQLQHRAQQVLEDTSLSKKEKNLVSFFTAFGFDVLHAGATKLINGAIIGIPISFNYRSTSDIDQNQLALLDHPDFSWQSRTGQRILTTLLMSNRAQQFAIAREIYYINSHYVYTNGFAAFTCFVSAYGAGRYINQRLDLYKRPFKQRLGLYSILGSMAGVMFFFLKDLHTTSMEQQADEKAADIGKDYILGGIEYYGYMIERNKALREAMGDNGAKYYTAGGNVRERIRVSQVPLTSRFDYMKERLEKLEMADVLSAPPNPHPKGSDITGGRSPVTTTMDAITKNSAEDKKLINKKLKF